MKDFNINATNGLFKNYAHLGFPADARNCAKCHLTDAWKTKPSREACGSCHDNVNFALGTLSPARVLGKPVAGNCTTNAACSSGWPLYPSATCNTGTGKCEVALHGGGSQADDAACANCHPASAGLSPISTRHAIAPPPFKAIVELSLTAPANGTSYVAGEAPTLKIVFKNASDNQVIDPATFTAANWKRLNLFVSGPRSGAAMPVLTTASLGTAALRAKVTNGASGPWNFTTAIDLQLVIDGGGTLTVPVLGGTFASLAAVTPAEVAAWLNANAAFLAVATASSSATTVTIKSNSTGATSSVEILASGVATAMSFAVAEAFPVETRSYMNNDLRIQADPKDEDPKITRTPGANGYLEYSLRDVSGLKPGSYVAFIEALPASGLGGIAKLPFQVGTATADKKIATNCLSCHEDTRMHAGYFALPFDTDFCINCHDYQRQLVGKAGWGNSNNGFGAAPLSRRVHGVHYGRYVTKPLEIHATYGAEYAELIFPQDIRNCTKCHAETDSWKKNPSRLACNSCHDRSSAILHAALNTLDPTPAEPFSGDEEESCLACHGGDRQFSADKVHAISKPYVPPYIREP
ncbi:MAG: multiheme c-type cytochrome [Myxococcaceae bacterium]